MYVKYSCSHFFILHRGLELVTVGVIGSGLGFSVFDRRIWSHAVQGCLAHKKTHTLSGTPWDPRHRPSVGS